jgi:heme-degrading monooxygenase HmoA
MLARMARYEVDPDRCDDVLDVFQSAVDEIKNMTGFERGFVMVDSESGAVTTITLWTDQNAAEASATAAAGARQRAIRELDGEVQSVQVFNVVREFTG